MARKPTLAPDADKDILFHEDTGKALVGAYGPQHVPTEPPLAEVVDFDGRFGKSRGLIEEELTTNKDYKPYVSKRPSVNQLSSLDPVAASIYMLRALLEELGELEGCTPVAYTIFEWLGDYTVERVNPNQASDL